MKGSACWAWLMGCRSIVRLPFGEKNGVLWVAGIRGIYELSLASLDGLLAFASEQFPAQHMVLHRVVVIVLGCADGYCLHGCRESQWVSIALTAGSWLSEPGGVVHLHFLQRSNATWVTHRVSRDCYRVRCG